MMANNDCTIWKKEDCAVCILVSVVEYSKFDFLRQNSRGIFCGN